MQRSELLTGFASLSHDVQELSFTFSEDTDRLEFLCSAFNVLEREPRCRELREGRDWQLLSTWKRRNGNVMTASSLKRLERIILCEVNCGRSAKGLDNLYWYTMMVSRYVAEYQHEYRQINITSVYMPAKRPIEWLRRLLWIRSDWDTIGVVNQRSFARAPASVAAALGVCSRGRNREWVWSDDRNESSSYAFAIPAALFIGDALFAQHAQDPEAMSGTLEQIFSGDIDLERFFEEHLPPFYLPEEHRRTLLEGLDQGVLQEVLPPILSMMFVILGKGEEREARVAALFSWAEQHIQEFPEITSYLAYALAANPTSLVEKWLPKCYTLFDQHTIPLPDRKFAPYAKKYFLLAQEQFADYTQPLPWLAGEEDKGQRDLSSLLSSCVRVGHFEAIRALSAWAGRGFHFRKVESALIFAARVPSNVLPDRTLIEALIDAIDPLSLVHHKDFLRFVRDNSYGPLFGRVRDRAPSISGSAIEKQRDAAICCLLVARIAENPRIQEGKYAALRQELNAMIPYVNEMIEHLKGEEEVAFLVPKQAIPLLSVPTSFLGRTWCWLRCRVWPTALVAAQIFPRAVTYPPRQIWQEVFHGGWSWPVRLGIVGCSAVVAAIFAYFYTVCLPLWLLFSAYYTSGALEYVQRDIFRPEELAVAVPFRERGI